MYTVMVEASCGAVLAAPVETVDPDYVFTLAERYGAVDMYVDTDPANRRVSVDLTTAEPCDDCR